MIIMSVDLGKARTGIAVSDKGEGFAFPKTVINEYNTEKLVLKIADWAKELMAEEIVVGLPKNMDGSLGWRAEECSEIAEKIKAATSLPVVLWDERCTTVSAHTALNFTDTRGKKRKEVVDAVAAVIILEDYLAYKKNRS
ncbi:MAG: Holliday junction resolvase RuvX [Clostridia bacterium]|nr:Holliday junction resolvase RuvX [Clostridia bacterium]